MLHLHKLQRYRTLTESYNVLPVGWGKDRKAPCLSGWQLNPNLSLEDICNYREENQDILDKLGSFKRVLRLS